MDPQLSEILNLVKQIAQKVGVQVAPDEGFESMPPEAQNQAVEKEFNANKQKMMGSAG